MDFNDTKEEAEFRAKVKTWLKKNATKSEKVMDDTMQLMFKKMLYQEQEIGKQKKLKLVMLLLPGLKNLVV